MGRGTPIEWCDDTVTPVPGCDGCELSSRGTAEEVAEGVRAGHCYAEFLHTTMRRAGRPGYAPSFFAPTPFYGRVWAAARAPDLVGVSRPRKPWLDGRRRVIFLNDMGDALSKNITFEFLLAEVIEPVRSEAGERHDWLWLTKRPRRMGRFARWLKARGVAWPPNLWAGTSITSAATLARARDLCSFDGPVMRFVSLEPLLGPLSLPPALLQCPGGAEYGRGLSRTTVHAGGCCARRIHLAIIGGESGPAARPCDVAWIRALLAQLAGAGVPAFVKQLGAHVLTTNDDGLSGCAEGDWPALALDRVEEDLDGYRDGYQGAPVRVRLLSAKGGDPSEWPADLRVRQFPASR